MPLLSLGVRPRYRRVRVALCAFLLSFAVFANEIVVRDAHLVPAEGGGYALSADFEAELGERLQDALNQGVPLHFLLEFECFRPRWYWFDDTVAQKSQTLRLSYHALTSTYRLSIGGLQQTYGTLDEAMRALGTVRDWHVLQYGDLQPQSSYEVALRMALDVNQLPKPFQVSALTNRDWTLTSDWQRWGFATNREGKIAQ